MDTDKHRSEFVAGELTHSIVGAAFEVVNALGHGLHEKPYENAMVVELVDRNFKVEQQAVYEIDYKGTSVGTFVPDLIVEDEVIVDTKVIDKITDHERGQMLNYLRITGLKIGLIINFKNPKLQWDRVIL
ncbi:GxxExxY protein [Synoicihabitans lomoniglobus]|uniref:GxxExxY protein n=1 Tax=Synoicihabitans lomoniglobus TaxID=2909285 RepID=A0AAF0CHT8_9BACT|nr:GxxExxY protein [Opitutaceae bacterium LMO-M01]WED64667.1 GxxExxY protein [Opitutaceae bacterium LMO-M01]